MVGEFRQMTALLKPIHPFKQVTKQIHERRRLGIHQSASAEATRRDKIHVIMKERIWVWNLAAPRVHVLRMTDSGR